MKLRYLSILAAASLLAACESAPTETGAKAGAGQAAPPAAAAPAPGIAAGSVEDFQKNVGDRVFFDLNKSNLRGDAKAILDKQVAWLKKYPAYAITVEGHCDERGTREYNLGLGERRATAVKKYMLANGIPAARVKTISYGKERPVCMASNEACWSQNRRGVTVLSK
ncbi:MAG: peptidoglycan-associated lipoprotein Pal [Magnetospirillum sp.]|nr:peptidoglycan-associated lipoprotein Pal [Magnetospirillum sp.]